MMSVITTTKEFGELPAATVRRWLDGHAATAAGESESRLPQARGTV